MYAASCFWKLTCTVSEDCNMWLQNRERKTGRNAWVTKSIHRSLRCYCDLESSAIITTCYSCVLAVPLWFSNYIESIHSTLTFSHIQTTIEHKDLLCVCWRRSFACMCILNNTGDEYDEAFNEPEAWRAAKWVGITLFPWSSSTTCSNPRSHNCTTLIGVVVLLYWRNAWHIHQHLLWLNSNICLNISRFHRKKCCSSRYRLYFFCFFLLKSKQNHPCAGIEYIKCSIMNDGLHSLHGVSTRAGLLLRVDHWGHTSPRNWKQR